jgi:hypothetical protein
MQVDQRGRDDDAYETYVRQEVEKGIAAADAGRVLSHEEAVARLLTTQPTTRGRGEKKPHRERRDGA